jgi:hypothetical protein
MLQLARPLPAMSLAVVGAPYDPARKFEILLCVPGETVDLRPEPKNRHDERAIAVFSARGVQLGYLTADRCGRIGQLIRDGHELRAIYQAETSFGAWIRVAFDGEQPRLPDDEGASIAREPVDGWFPDEVWPDD